MDIDKWYPNVLSRPSAKIVRRMWEESELTIDGIDMEYICNLKNLTAIILLLDFSLDVIISYSSVKDRKQQF